MTLMRKKFVSEYHWIDENEMLDLVAIAQSAPGAIAVNGAIVVGYKPVSYTHLDVYKRPGRHLSQMVDTRIASVKSPWLTGVNVGDIHTCLLYTSN